MEIPCFLTSKPWVTEHGNASSIDEFHWKTIFQPHIKPIFGWVYTGYNLYVPYSNLVTPLQEVETTLPIFGWNMIKIPKNSHSSDSYV